MEKKVNIPNSNFISLEKSLTSLSNVTEDGGAVQVRSKPKQRDQTTVLMGDPFSGLITHILESRYVTVLDLDSGTSDTPFLIEKKLVAVIEKTLFRCKSR